MFPHFHTLPLILNNLHLPFEPHPNHNKNDGNTVFIGGLRGFGKIGVKQKADDFGRFWSILAKCFPTVYPLQSGWVNTNQKIL